MVAAGANPIQITRGIERTAKALVTELKSMSKEVRFEGFECLILYTVLIRVPDLPVITTTKVGMPC